MTDRWKGWLRLAVSVSLFLGIITGVVFLVFYFFGASSLDKMFRSEAPFGILVVGEDGTGRNRTVHFTSVATIWPGTSRIGFISLYSRTRLAPDEATLSERIAYSDIDEVRDELEEEIGIRIPWYIKVRPDDVVRLIDLIEGLPYYLSRSDLLEGENLPTGEFLLTGSLVPRLLTNNSNTEYAEAFQLFRHYSLLLNLWRDRNNKWQLLKHNVVFGNMAAGIDTNIGVSGLYQLGNRFFQDSKWIPLFLEIPVKREKDAFLIDKDTAAIYLKEYRKLLSEKKLLYSELPPKMEIKNGTDIPALAKKMRTPISRKGISVLEFTNADRHDYPESILIDTAANASYAENVTRLLGINKTYHAVNRALFTDLILILGADYKELKIQDD